MATKLEVWLDDEVYSMLLALVNNAEDARTSEVLRQLIFKEYFSCKDSEFSSNNLEARVTHIEEFQIEMLKAQFKALRDIVLNLDRRVRDFTLSERAF